MAKHIVIDKMELPFEQFYLKGLDYPGIIFENCIITDVPAKLDTMQKIAYALDRLGVKGIHVCGCLFINENQKKV